MISFPRVMLAFTKMNGAGNDFVVVDNRDGSVRLTREQVVRICDRRRGVGADGLLMLVRSASGRAPWAWEFFNCDGSAAAMCGNGARCFAKFIRRLTGADGDVVFETGAGVITARFDGAEVTVNLTVPREMRLNESVALETGAQIVHSVNTGVPHAVVLVPETESATVQSTGAAIRHHPHFGPTGTNVNFVQILEPGSIRVRTYERGVEGETLACGTGVTAAALGCARVRGFASPVKVLVQGGDTLGVSFETAEAGFRDVHLSGPADFVFEGRLCD